MNHNQLSYVLITIQTFRKIGLRRELDLSAQLKRGQCQIVLIVILLIRDGITIPVQRSDLVKSSRTLQKMMLGSFKAKPELASSENLPRTRTLLQSP